MIVRYTWYLTNDIDCVTGHGYVEMSGILSAAMKRFVDGEQGGATKFGRSNKKSPNRNCRRQPNNSFPSKRHFRNRSTRSDIHSINETGFQLIRIDPRYRDRFTWNRAIFVNVRGLKCLLNLWRRRRGETFDNELLWN